MPCPWRVDASVGQFPPSVFRHSARTAYELSEYRLGCHDSSDHNRPLTCAGFLLRGAQHNLSVRLHGPDEDVVDDGGRGLYRSYRKMAVATASPRTTRRWRPAGTGRPPHHSRRPRRP
jgi:uncharacterized protein DUF6283